MYNIMEDKDVHDMTFIITEVRVLAEQLIRHLNTFKAISNQVSISFLTIC